MTCTHDHARRQRERGPTSGPECVRHEVLRHVLAPDHPGRHRTQPPPGSSGRVFRRRSRSPRCAMSLFLLTRARAPGLVVRRVVDQAVGSRTVNRPPVVAAWATISPPALRASRRASASPRPAPRWSCAPALPRTPGSKMRVGSSVAMPAPSSETVMVTFGPRGQGRWRLRSGRIGARCRGVDGRFSRRDPIRRRRGLRRLGASSGQRSRFALPRRECLQRRAGHRRGRLSLHGWACFVAGGRDQSLDGSGHLFCVPCHCWSRLSR